MKSHTPQPPESDSINNQTSLPSVRKRVVWILFCLVGLGGILRVYVCIDRPLSGDEAFSVHNALSNTYLELITESGKEKNHPPLSFLFIKLSYDLTGSRAPLVMKFIPFACGVLCIPAIFLLGREIHSSTLGCWAAALAAFEPLMVDQSAQVRMFTILQLTNILALWLAVHLVNSGFRKRSQSLFLGLLLGASLWNNQLILAAWGAVGMVFLWHALSLQFRFRRPREARQVFLSIAIIFGSAILLAAPHVIDLVRSRLPHRRSNQAMSNTEIIQYTWYRFQEIELPPKHMPTFRRRCNEFRLDKLCLAFTLLGSCFVFMKHRLAALLLFFSAGLTLILVFLIRQRIPFLDDRYFTTLLPTLWISCAALPAIARRKALKRISAMVLLLLIALHVWFSMHVAFGWQLEKKFMRGRTIRSMSKMVDKSDRIVYFAPYYFGTWQCWYYGLPVDSDLAESLWRRTEVCATVDPKRTTWVIIRTGTARREAFSQSIRAIDGLLECYGHRDKSNILSIRSSPDRLVIMKIDTQGAVVH